MTEFGNGGWGAGICAAALPDSIRLNDEIVIKATIIRSILMSFTAPTVPRARWHAEFLYLDDQPGRLLSFETVESD
jgi:hypothetical protein